MTLLKVTAYKSVRETTQGQNKDVFEMLERIRVGAGRTAEIVNQIRILPKDKGNELKKDLSGVCFNGTFKVRSKSGLIAHSGLIVLDLDNFETQEDAVIFKNSIVSDNFIFAAWISPSGKGVKILVRIPQDPKNHKKYFDALKKYFNSPYWDDSGSDVSRFCFESYDPTIYINPESEIWSQIEEEELEEIGAVSVSIPLKSEALIIDRLLVWFNKKYGNTKGNRNNNIFKLAAAFFDFGIDQATAENQLLKFAESDFKPEEIKRTLRSAYSKTNGFGSKFFEDEQKIEIIQKLIRGGKNEKEIVAEFPDEQKTDVSAYITSIKDQMSLNEYWYYNDKNAIKLSIHNFKYWLQQNNFFKFYPEDSKEFILVRVDNNSVEEVSKDQIKDFVLKDIINRPDVGTQPFEFMAGNIGYFKKEFLSFLDPVKIDFKEDTATESFLYYKNCAVKITADSVQYIDYLDLSGHIWRDQIIDRDFKFNPATGGQFEKFIWLVSGQDQNKFNSFKSAIGFLLHTYKTSATNRAIILNDETISDTPNGGSGKGIFWKALGHIRKTDFLAGKKYDERDKFNLQTAEKDTQIFVFDDVKKNFNFELLFNLITEGITLEYKGAGAVNLPVEKSPKILITTNYTIGGSSGSFSRRIFELEFSSYFSANHTPVDEFGSELFKNWSAAEWSLFDNFMLSCLQLYFKKGLLKQEHVNLPVRKFIKDTSIEFLNWVEMESKDNGVLCLDTEINAGTLHDIFLSEYENLKGGKVTKQKFKKWLKVYADFYNLELKEGRNSMFRYIKFKVK